MVAIGLEDRFWSKVDQSDPDGCWPWTGGCFTKAGFEYGAFWVGPNNRVAHQVAWELANGKPFPKGLQGNHSCDTPLCCRPSHVVPGTQADNMRDMNERHRAVYKVRKGVVLECPGCARDFYVAAGRADTAKYCSRSCAAKVRWSSGTAAWNRQSK